VLSGSTRSEPDEPGDVAVPRVGVGATGWPIDTSAAHAVAWAATAADARSDVTAIDTALFVRATDVFDGWRASDDYDDLRTLVGSRTAELTPHIRGLLTAGRAGTTDAQRDAIVDDAQQLKRRIADLLDETPVVVLPIALVGVMRLAATEVEIGGRTEPLDSLRILAPSRAISLLGLPALAVPAITDDRGLPVGVQLVGRPGGEAELFTVARALATTR
jgi:amidase